MQKSEGEASEAFLRRGSSTLGSVGGFARDEEEGTLLQIPH